MKEFVLIRCGKYTLTFPTLEAWNSYYDMFKEQFGEQDVQVFKLIEISNNKKS